MKVGFLVLLIAFLVIMLMLARYGPQEEQHLVVAVKSSQEEAIALAEELKKGGYDTEVYLTQRDIYVVTLGRFASDEIPEVKAKAIRNGYADPDAMPNNGEGFITIVYPKEKEEVFIITERSPFKEDAIEKARTYRKEYEQTKVFQLVTGDYAVTIGKFPKRQARLLQEQAVRGELIPKESYLSDGKGLGEVVFPSKEEQRYVVARSFEQKNPAVKYARDLKKDTAYKTEVFYTSTDTYVVTIGQGGESTARRILERARGADYADQDGYLTDGSEFRARVDLESAEKVELKPRTEPKNDGILLTGKDKKPVAPAGGDFFDGNPRPIDERGGSSGTGSTRDPELLDPSLLETPPVTSSAQPRGTILQPDAIGNTRPATRAATPPPAKKVPVNDNFYLIVLTSPQRAEAIRQATIFRQQGFESQAFSTTNGKYAVTIGHYEKKTAEALRTGAIETGSINKDAYLVSGREFSAQIYP